MIACWKRKLIKMIFRLIVLKFSIIEIQRKIIVSIHEIILRTMRDRKYFIFCFDTRDECLNFQKSDLLSIKATMSLQDTQFMSISNKWYLWRKLYFCPVANISLCKSWLMYKQFLCFQKQVSNVIKTYQIEILMWTLIEIDIFWTWIRIWKWDFWSFISNLLLVNSKY